MINPSNTFVAFLIEIVMRMGKKSPKLFVYIQWASGLITAITGIPAFLEGIGVSVTGVFADVENKTIAIASLVGFFISLLPVKGDTAVVNQSGEPLKTIDQAKLPFTAKAENKEAAQANHPVVAVATTKK